MHRLLAALRINNDQPPMDKRCVLVKIGAFGIRPARRERALHAVQDGSAAACIPFKIHKTADTTHRQFLLKIVISFFYMHSKREI